MRKNQDFNKPGSLVNIKVINNNKGTEGIIDLKFREPGLSGKTGERKGEDVLVPK